MNDFTVTTVEAPDGGRAHLVHTEHVNWVVLHDESGVTLIDGGYPGHADTVIASVREIGARPDDIRGALLTHAHVDHIGGLARLTDRYAFDLQTDPAEVRHARRLYLQQATPLDIARQAYRPRVLRWATEVLALGVRDTTGIPTARPFTGDGVLDLPGRPIPVAAQGHTDGHSAYLVAGGTVLVSGDALVTGHGFTAHTGPQCLHHVFHHDVERNRASVRSLAALGAQVIFPGHGDAWFGSVADAVDQALTRSR